MHAFFSDLIALLLRPFMFCWRWLVKPVPRACLICGKPCLSKHSWTCSHSCFVRSVYPPEHMLYVGSSKYLKGKTAIVMHWHPYTKHADPKKRYAQFDDRTSGHGFGWSIFNREDFAEPFPRRCEKCFKYTVTEEVIDHTAARMEDGVASLFVVKDLRIPVCQRCGWKSFTKQVDEQIQEARQKLLDNR